MNNKYFEQFIELLNKKGIIRNMQIAKRLSPEIAIGEVQKAIDTMCVSNTIVKALQRDKELEEAYAKASAELMMNKVMEVIDLKKDDNFEYSPQEKFAKEIAKVLTGGMIKDLEDLFKN